MHIFKCAKCEKPLDGFAPSACGCGHPAPVLNGVYQFTDDRPISVEGDGLKWLGYENVGANYEPGYFYNKDDEVGIGNSDKLVEYLGRGKIVLDLGAGLGGSSISFARAGLRVIAADISQAMLEIAVSRAGRHNVPKDGIVFARMNGYKLELADDSVDAVLAVDVLHQVDRPEQMMDEIMRVLKADGFFLQYGASKSLELTAEQQEANHRYTAAHQDIERFYHRLIQEAGYDEPPFDSVTKAENCVEENFLAFGAIENTGIYGADHMAWPLKLGPHKLKTRASGVKQLIPDAVHDAAWAKTDAYARGKYGEAYEDITRYYHFTGSMVLYRRRAGRVG